MVQKTDPIGSSLRGFWLITPIRGTFLFTKPQQCEDQTDCRCYKIKRSKVEISLNRILGVQSISIIQGKQNMLRAITSKLRFVDLLGRGGPSYWREPGRERVWQSRNQIFVVDAWRPAIVPTQSHVFVIEMHLPH